MTDGTSIQAGDLAEQDLRAAVLKRLAEMAITEVRIGFDGSGDDGQITEISATRADGQADALTWSCEIPSQVRRDRVWDHDRRAYVALDEPRLMTMHELLDNWAYDLLSETEVNWTDGDGGFGEIVIVPAEDAIRCEMNERVIEVDTSEYEL
jgi:hypothetical protein